MKLGMVLGICVLSAAVGVACGDSDDGSEGGGSGGSAGKSTSGGSGSGKGGTQSSSGGEAAGGEGSGEAGATAGGSTSTGSGGAAGGDEGAGAGGTNPGEGGSTNGGAASGGAGNCPDVFGDYTITQAEGECGDLDDQVTQTFAGTDVNCFLHFVSEGALNGGADLDANGDFSGTQLYVGSVQRNPCSGEYDSGDGSMVVTCGGVGDACTVTLAPE